MTKYKVFIWFVFQGTIPTSLGRFKPIFTEEMERELANHCRDLDGRFYGIGMKNLQTIAYQFADLNGLDHCFNKEKKMAGKNWVYAFCLYDVLKSAAWEEPWDLTESK